MSKSKDSRPAHGWFSSSSGKVELWVTKVDAANGAHMGQCASDIAALRNVPYIAKQLAKIDPQDLIDDLKGYGAWDASELQDHQANLNRVLWLACGDVNEERE